MKKNALIVLVAMSIFVITLSTSVFPFLGNTHLIEYAQADENTTLDCGNEVDLYGGDINPANCKPTDNSNKTTGKVVGSESSVIDLLCTPGDESTNTFGKCLNKMIRFGIVIAMFFSVGVLIWAGYLYMSGDPNAMGKAKKLIMGVGSGLGILLFTYLVLGAVNPDILKPDTLLQQVQVNKPGCSVTTDKDCLKINDPTKK